MWLVRRDISRSLRTWVASWIRFFNWRSRDRENYFILQKKKHLEYAHGRTCMVLGSTDPACHSTLVLVEALDLGQVCRRWTLHLETLLEERIKQVRGRLRLLLFFISEWHIDVCTTSACTKNRQLPPQCLHADASLDFNHRNHLGRRWLCTHHQIEPEPVETLPQQGGRAWCVVF